MARFYYDNVTVGGEALVSEIYDSYRAYCESNGERAFAANRFSLLLSKVNPAIQRGSRRTQGKMTRYFEGISIERGF